MRRTFNVAALFSPNETICKHITIRSNSCWSLSLICPMIVSRTDHCVLEFLFLSHYIQSLQGLEDQTGHTLPMAADDPTGYDAISLCPGIWALEPTSDCQEVRGTDCGSNSQREPSRVPFSCTHTQTCPPSLLGLSVTAKDAIQDLTCADSHS